MTSNDWKVGDAILCLGWEFILTNHTGRVYTVSHIQPSWVQVKVPNVYFHVNLLTTSMKFKRLTSPFEKALYGVAP